MFDSLKERRPFPTSNKWINNSRMSLKDYALALMLERPLEPLIIPKGDKLQLDYALPDNYLTKRCRKDKTILRKRFDRTKAKTMVVKNISVPDISEIRQFPASQSFSVFFEEHQIVAEKLIDIFMNQQTLDDLIAVAAYCRDRINPYLFNYCLCSAILHREDTKDVPLPSVVQSFPAKFMSSNVFVAARQEAMVFPEQVREPIVIPRNFTANEKEPEQAVAYFREDVGINLHHWHWHLVYPFRSSNPRIMNKDRRGELFYYMHQQVLARYNAERLSNYMLRVTSFNLREDIPQAYFSKLHQAIASRAWPSRSSNMHLSDLDRSSLIVKIETLEKWMDSIKEAITKGYAMNSGNSRVDLLGENGIDVLGNMIESSQLSINRSLYGDLHNMGHVLVSYCHDPDGRYLESFSVMGDTSTAMRDPIFYRWHNTINEIFLSLKNHLPYYTRAQLDFTNITLTDFNISTDNRPINTMTTFWEQNDIDISRGLDFSPGGSILVRITYLQHEEFSYNIKIKNMSSNQVKGTVRIFLAPTLDEEGNRMTFEKQRKLMIELDKFTVNITQGENVITRLSQESSVTIPYEMTYRDMKSLPPPSETTQQTQARNFCGCGWPHNMLIPKGKEEGFPVVLFAMISDYETDKVVQNNPNMCVGAESYCGAFGLKYPDKRAMGYPFDRVAKSGVVYLNDFMTPNMIAKESVIIHKNEVSIRQPEQITPIVQITPTVQVTPTVQATPMLQLGIRPVFFV